MFNISWKKLNFLFPNLCLKGWPLKRSFSKIHHWRPSWVATTLIEIYVNRYIYDILSSFPYIIRLKEYLIKLSRFLVMNCAKNLSWNSAQESILLSGIPLNHVIGAEITQSIIYEMHVLVMISFSIIISQLQWFLHRLQDLTLKDYY